MDYTSLPGWADVQWSAPGLDGTGRLRLVEKHFQEGACGLVDPSALLAMKKEATAP